MANFGFIRRDLAAGNRVRLGITSYLLISLVVFVIAGYLFLRLSGFGPTMLSTEAPKEDPNAIPTNVGTVTEALTLWQPNALNGEGDPFVLPKSKETENTLSSQTAVFTPLTGNDFTSRSSSISSDFNMSGLEKLTGDDGGFYVKTNFSVYSLNVPVGTVLSGKKNTSYIVGNDRQLYQVMQGGKKVPVTTAPAYKLKDKIERFYTVSKNLQLRLHTPGPKGRFIGPDKRAYNITRSGDIEDVETQEFVTAISGEGEFTGSDDKPYVVMQGLLFSVTEDSASFGSSVMTGSGYFIGPDGKKYLRGEDGKIYLVGDDGKLTLANIGGSGVFTGPDGVTYFKDENGDIRKLIGSGVNGEGQKTGLPKGYFVGPDGKKYYVDSEGRIYEVGPDGSLTPSSIGGSGTFIGPDGKTYKLDENGNIVPVEEGTTASIDSNAKGKYLVGPDGKKYFVDKDGKTYLVDESGNLIPAKLPSGIYRDADGNVFKVDDAGNITNTAQKLPSGSYTDQHGNKYYVDENGRTFKVMPDGSLVEVDKLPEGTILTNSAGESFRVQSDGTVKREGTNALAEGTFIGPDGKRYMKDKNGRLFMVTDDGKLVPVDKIPEGTFIGPDGALYHADAAGNITKLSEADTVSLPKGHFYGPDGKLYYSDENGKLYEVGPDGKLTPVDKLPAGAFVGPDGKTYYSDGNGNITSQDNASENVLLPEGTFIGPDGNTYYTDKDGKIYRINPDGSRTPVSKLPAGTFVGPDGATYTVDANGRITKINTKAVAGRSQQFFGSLSNSPFMVTGYQLPEPSKRSAKINVSENLNNFNTGKDFEPNAAAKQIKGGRVYTRITPEIRKTDVEKTAEELAAEEKERQFFFPVGTRIPFYLLTHITSKADTGLIEGVVAENVFFHDKAIPAGTRLYGSVGEVKQNNRYEISFSMLQYPNGKSLSISADTYDVNMQFGLEAYYTPPPAWATALKFLNVGAIHELNKDVGRSSEGEQLGDTEKVTEYLEELVEEIIHNQKGYYTLPAGTPGVLMLTDDLQLNDIDYHSGKKRKSKAENLMGAKQLAQSLASSAANAHKEQMISAAQAGIPLHYSTDPNSPDPTNRTLQIAPQSSYDLYKNQMMQRNQALSPQSLGVTPQSKPQQQNIPPIPQSGAVPVHNQGSNGADLSNVFKQ